MMNFLLRTSPYKVKGKVVFRLFLPKKVVQVWGLDEEPQLFWAQFDGRRLTLSPVIMELEEVEKQFRKKH